MNFALEELVPDYLLRIIISGIVSMGVAWSAIPVIRNICIERNLSDSPIKRSSHIDPTPTFGGIGVFAGTLIGYFLWNFVDEGFLMHNVFAGAIILFFLGIKDDIYALDAKKKIIIQVATALLVVVGSDLRVTSFFGVFNIYEVPYIVSVLFSVFLFIALINAFNLIDGVDGLAAGIAMIASSGFALWFMIYGYWSMAALGISLSASLFAFLRYNFSKTSKIFLGDTGSLFIGFLVSVMALKFVDVNVNNTDPDTVYLKAPLIAIALLSVPIFDTLRVFSVRVFRRKSPFKADRTHMHHLLLDLGGSHLVISLIHYAFTIIFTACVYYFRKYFTNTQLAIIIMFVFAGYFILGFYLEKYRLRHHKNKLSKSFKQPQTETADAKVKYDEAGDIKPDEPALSTLKSLFKSNKQE